ncbi:ImmA/IrrE family metallo-endopeptidase [Candidatus Chlorohelix sp.]|uniref:ImmA/IrrE family metallo-endopeptidase n=1 Tax=Candidatus Chlorohelix sp. TaxID=3139201 RepID=UPI003032F037
MGIIEWGLVETALEFWENAGGYSPDLEEAALLTFPLSIERLAGLDVHEAQDWLLNHGFPTPALALIANRPLRACLVALGGERNLILLEATDSIAEQRFSLAHEIAHFLLDYLQPRELINRQLGKVGLEVLESRRLPTIQERVSAIIEGATLKPYRHFMERHNGDLNQETGRVEQRADLLAVELLSPAELALLLARETFKGTAPFNDKLARLTATLEARFGLPLPVAESYAFRLANSFGVREGFKEWLGIS